MSVFVDDLHSWWRPPLRVAVTGLRSLEKVPAAIPAALAYCLVAYLSLEFTQDQDSIPTIWPANGIVLAALILVRKQSDQFLTLMLGLFANVVANALASRPAMVNVGFALTNTIEICAAFSMLRRTSGTLFEFNSMTSFGSFIFAAATACLVSASTASLFAVLVSHTVSWHVFICWLCSNFLGLLTVTPALVRIFQHGEKTERRSTAETFFLFGILIFLIAATAALREQALSVLLLPVLVVIACRLGPKATSAAGLILSTAILVSVPLGLDLGKTPLQYSWLSDTQFFQFRMLTALITVMLLAEVVASQDGLQKRLSKELAIHDTLNHELRAHEQALTIQAAELERANSRLNEAIDILPEGIVILDADNRYVTWNKRYEEIYHKAKDTLVVGRSLEEAIRIGLGRRMYPEAIGREEAWLAERLKHLRTPAKPHEQLLDDGRCCLIEERRTAEGGLISLRVDITEMKQREASIRLLFENNPLPMFVVSRTTKAIRAVNTAAMSRYGYTRNEFLVMKLQDIQRGDLDSPKLVDTVDEFKPSDEPHQFRHFCRDGRSIEVEVYYKPLTHQGEDALLIAAIDVTERRIADRKASYMARHDALTSLPNRHLLSERMQLAMARAVRGERVALLLVDLDNFKTINDTLGHGAGDELLQIVADRLLCTLSETDTVARLGGDEFAVLLVGVETVESAASAAQRIIDILNRPMRIGSKDIVCGGSVGIALAPDDTCDASELLRQADMALYAAKESQRGTFRMFQPEFDAKVKARNLFETQVRDAILNDDFEVHYQIITSLSTLKPIGAEALLRWRHPERGLSSPVEFIPIAEEIGMIGELGKKVMRRACMEAASWPENMTISVNVSAVELEGEDFVETIKDILHESGLASHRLIVEVTESTVMNDLEAARRILNEVSSLGVEIAMDDFGTGYSSLSSLTKVPFQKIKIDRSFVRDLGSSSEARAVLSTIVELAKTLGMLTTAEGIETREQLDIVQAYGCTSVQGYLFHKPQPSEDVRRYIADASASASEAA